ncbi:MAG: DNA polymerase II [Gammaproteobacteria bacterium]|nr:DNA polymerase II [Gammaproteobacteria bacterium]MBT3724750.1 DNA polymerase II [Gammaproteobacteria bacterium]MBT4078930.1 DNA polymerase II [Gammaproteobacteria bacterium]MBT4195501.1 DNA polymerase II [Gammaproteobacteria bacterium]MBT4448777.1 DNA polymerase II [Gammaproteobacteria bacterium]
MANSEHTADVNKGFLLSRQSFDRQGRSNINLWLSTEKGPVKLSISNEHPVCFVEQSNTQRVDILLKNLNNNYSTKPLELHTFSQQVVAGLYFNNLRTFYDVRTILTEAGVEVYEGNIRLEERYLMERFVYGSIEFSGDESSLAEQAKSGYIEYRNIRIKPCDYVPNLSVVSLDIECSERGELYSIGFYSGETDQDNLPGFNKVIMIKSEQLSEKESAENYIEWVSNEIELLQALELTIQSIDPDVIIGWNIINFDFRLLAKRSALHNIKLRLGRDKSVMRWRDSRTEKNQGFITIDGRMVIDGIAALKAEAYSFPSFSLEAIGLHFLGRGKETDDVENRLEAITHDFKFNKIKLASYNLQDCVLVWDIFEKINLMDYLIFRSQLTGLELDRAGGSVAAFVNLYLPKLHRQGYVSPNLPKGGGLASPGGYVMSSKPGLYKNVLVLDFKSLYPSIIRTFKIDPLGLIEGQKDPDNAIEGFRGGCFSRDKHLLPEIITDLWAKRDQAKKDNDKARSQAIKIIMNSFYGVLGSGGCPFYDTKLASSITLRGHEIMQQTASWIESKGYEVIYGDTDSTFVLLNEKVTDEQANEIGQTLASKINKKWQVKLAEEHQIDCFLEIEFESHFSRFLMPTIRGSEQGSKKRYAGLLKTAKEEKLIFKGLENVRTDWTELARNFQMKLYQMVFHSEDPTDYILETVRQTLSGERNSELVYRKRLRRNLASYVKNVPPHVKAARIADAENKKQGKPLKYQNKGWISYLMTTSGPQPMEYVSENIDFQFYVDRQIEPVADGILPFIGLSFKEIVDLQMTLF